VAKPGDKPSILRPEAAALRMLDANLNRATEGLRLVEDYCRFALNDQHLTGLCKGMRHDLVETLRTIPMVSLISARETQNDVGIALSTPQERDRASLGHIAAAAWQRLQQALRVIEECLKLTDAEAAARVEALRYRTYTLAKATILTANSQARLKSARLYVLIDGGSADCDFVERVQALVEAGVDVIQLRDKRLDDRTLLSRARILRRTIDKCHTVSDRPSDPTTTHHSPLTAHPLFIVNDRPDIAVLSRADGVHVGQEEIAVHDVRQIVGNDMLIGVSTHTIEQARQAVLDGASYLGCGPTFPSETKQFDAFPGLDFLRQVAAEISLPAFAIGGITRENLPQVLAAGSTRVAVGGAVTATGDAGIDARRLLDLISRLR
jgi:thiamine-phosphate pyrophosphorylase